MYSVSLPLWVGVLCIAGLAQGRASDAASLFKEAMPNQSGKVPTRRPCRGMLDGVQWNVTLSTLDSSVGLAMAFSEIPAREAGKRRISSRMNVEVALQQAFFQAGRRPGTAATCKKPWMNEGGPGTMGFPRVGGFQRVSDQTLWPWRAWEGWGAASHHE